MQVLKAKVLEEIEEVKKSESYLGEEAHKTLLRLNS